MSNTFESVTTNSLWLGIQANSVTTPQTPCEITGEHKLIHFEDRLILNP